MPVSHNSERATPKGGEAPFLGCQLRLMLWLFGVAVAVVLVRGKLLHQAYPYNTFLFFPTVRFSDFLVYQPRFEHFGQEAFFARSGFPDASLPFFYLPVATVLAHLIYSFPRYPLVFYLGLVLCAAVGFGSVLAVSLMRRAMSPVRAISIPLAAAITSFPLLFLMDRANFEGVVWILVALGLLAIVRDRWWTAATLLAVAFAMKIFPGILFAVFLSKKKLRQLLYALVLAAALTALALHLIGPTAQVAARGSKEGFLLFVPLYALIARPAEWPFVHSLFSIVKQIAMCGGWDVHEVWGAYLGYNVAVAVIGPALYFKAIRFLPLLNQIIALTTCYVLLPWWSGDYALVHLYVPWGFFILWIVESWRNGYQPYSLREISWYLVPFAIVFTPQSYFFLGGHAVGGQIKAIALVALLIASLRFPLKSGISWVPLAARTQNLSADEVVAGVGRAD